MWIRDDAFDLVNLDKVSCIVVAPITEPESQPSASATHELLAITEKEESFRLASGSEAHCRACSEKIAQEFFRQSYFLLVDIEYEAR